ncbi:hypothetical protein HGRIS_008012 [Hohenbuehelia grisea]|uniref:Uncharacterized protein n=1 Tax=Hohenbuehelia grisea TaxID=104357 RepID=A0ABR3J6N4_9AGAR
MLQVYRNTVSSVSKPPTVLLLIAAGEDGEGWCKQFTQEGYNVVHVAYPPSRDDETTIERIFLQADKEIVNLGEDWALITYGLQSHDARALLVNMGLSWAYLKACVHFCPVAVTGKAFVMHDTAGKHIPTTFHLPASQETLHANLAEYCDSSTYDYHLHTSAPPPVSIYTYPLVPESPPFPLLTKAPAQIIPGDAPPITPHVRSATSLSLSRTLALLRRCIGPHFDLEAIWEKHGQYEFVDRDAHKTLSTMVDVPYVNHIATMTGGTGRQELLRFYKYHFTGINVTPPDTEMISVSRTVGSDRIVDEMIFKCTHTTVVPVRFVVCHTALTYSPWPGNGLVGGVDLVWSSMKNMRISFLPGVPPTGKKLEFPVVGIIAFRGDKMYFE